MSHRPMVPLGEVLKHRKAFIEIDDLGTYKRCRVQLHAQGIVLRDQVPGAEIKTKKQQVCKAGEFLVAEIDAKVGGYGVVPPHLEGAIVSSHYFLFEIDEKKLDRRYLGYYIRTPGFHEQVAAQGSTNYAAIRPGHVLEYTIPLPPIADQQRLVERIDALATKVDEAKRLREEANVERDAIFQREAAAVFRKERWPTLPLAEILAEDSRNGLGARPSEEPPGVPILRISAGTSRPDAVIDEGDFKYLTISEKELQTYRLQTGDLLACRFNGNLHYVGRFSIYLHQKREDRVYPDKLIRFRIDLTKAVPEFVRYAMNSPTGREAIEAFCTTTAGNIGISATELKTIPVPLPSIDDQHRVVEHLTKIHRKLAEVLAIAEVAQAEIDALLPSILDREFRGEL